MNPLQQIPTQVRKYLYLAYGVAALACTSAAAGYGATGHDVPAVVIGIGGALVPIGAAFSALATSNLTEPSTVSVTAPANVDLQVTEPIQEA